MSAPLRSSVWWRSFAVCSLLTAVTACGGAKIEPAAGSAEQITSPVQGQLTDEAPPLGSAVADSAEATADTAGEVAAPARSGAGTSTDTKEILGDTDRPAGKATSNKPTSDKSSRSAGAGNSAVQQLVLDHPIFGGDRACKPATLSEIPIGNVSTLSGVLGELFSPVRSALDTFVASQNACGGLNGHRIKLYIDDDQGDPSTASAKIQSMIQTRKVLAFVGNIQPLTIDAVVPVINRFKIPIIGSDLTNPAWFSNPLLFPQGAPQAAVGYGYLVGATKYFKKTNVGNVWCIEVPRSCELGNRSLKDLAPAMGATVKKDIQVSITAPSYVQQCLDLKNAGVEALAMTVDAATMNRLARSCEQVQYFPNVMAHPLGVGNEKQFFGNKWLGNAYVGLPTFPWMGDSTPAERYWQRSVQKFNPGFNTGNAASLGWTSGALLVAAAANLSEVNPTTQQLLDTLYTFKGQKFTELGGLAGPRTFSATGVPKIPYCLFAAVSNDANTGWKTVISKPTCSTLLAASDPQKAG